MADDGDNQIWDLVGKIAAEVDTLPQSTNPDDLLLHRDYLATPTAALKALLVLKKDLDSEKKVLRKTRLALELEREVYLDKLRSIELVGHELGWEDRLLSEIQEVLYFEEGPFKLISTIADDAEN
jgi:hypothetical protein